jgi:hypothetical protein
MEMRLLAVAILVGLLQDKKEPIQIDFKVEFKQIGRFSTFAFSGTTNLPVGTLLRATVYFPEEYERPNPNGPGAIKEMIPDHLFLRDYENQVRVEEGGNFSTELYKIRRKPFSLPYHGRITYDPTEQDAELLKDIRKKVQNERVEKIFAFKLGDEKDFPKECVESARLLDEDFKAIRELIESLKAKAAQPDGWAKFKDDYYLKVRKIQDGNEDRFTMFKYFVERKGKFYIQDLTESLIFIIEAFERSLKNPKDEKLTADVHEKLKDFEDLYAQGWEELDLDRPDAAKLKKPIEALAKPVEAALDMAGKAVAGKEFEWNQAREVLESTVTEAAFKLCDEQVQTTKKIHPFVTEVVTGFTDLTQALDDYLKKPTDDGKKAVETKALELRDSLKALRQFVGLE